MKSKFLLALLVGATLTASAQGSKDGIEYYKAGQHDNAITLLNKNLNSTGTDKALTLYYLGQAYLAKGDAAKAKQYFEQGVQADPKCGYNYVGLGSLALKDGNANLAKDQFDMAQKNAKKNAEILVDIARAYYNADQVKYAKEVEKYLAKAHKDSKNQEPSIYLFEGDRLAADQKWNEAATKYEQAILFDEDNPASYVKWTNVYYYVVPEFSTSKLEELLVKNPNSALAQRELAEKYYEMGKWTRAADKYGEYIANPNHFPEDKARYAILLYAGGKYDQAIQVSQEVLKNDPNNFQVSRIIVRSYNDLKDYGKALEASKALFSNPAFKDRYNASDYTVYSSLLMGAKDTTAAFNVLEEGVKAFPKNSGMLEALSDFYFDKKDYVKSADYGEMAVQNNENPTNAAYYNATGSFLGAATALRDDPAKAAEYAKRGAALAEKACEGFTPTDVPTRFLRRLALLQLSANDNIADKSVYDTCQKLITRLEADPESANPANPKNDLRNWVSAYTWIAQYYAAQHDEEQLAAAKEKQAHYQELFDQVAK